MSRPKEFDEATALRQAMELFWEQGFDQTSLTNLTNHLGVSRQSIYETFGDKNALYNAAITKYRKNAREAAAKAMNAPGPLRKVLRAYLESAVRLASENTRGCFCANAMVERAPIDPEARATAQAYAREIEAIFTRRFVAAQAAGELGPSKDPVALGKFFHGTMVATSVMARAFGDPEDLREHIDVALQVLD